MSAAALPELPGWIADAIRSPAIGLLPWLEGTRRPPLGDALSSAQTLVDWLTWLDDEAASREVDQALAGWVRERWGTLPDGPDDSPRRLARAWMLVCSLGAQWSAAEQLRGALRERVADRSRYLGALAPGTQIDPLGSFLGAVATRQVDRSLAPLWWEIITLPDDVLLRHLPRGLIGFASMPPANPKLKGRFDPQMVEALVTAGEALQRAIAQQRIEPQEAVELYLRAGRRLRRLFPKAAWWRPYVVLKSYAEPLRGWLSALFPELTHAGPVAPAPLHLVTRDDADLARWRELANGLRTALTRSADSRGLRHATRLMAEERAYAESTGDSEPLVLTLCSLATALRSQRPELAVEWAEEARRWAPWNAYSWTTLLRATWELDGPDASLEVAFEGVERVPLNQTMWHELGENLEAAGCLEQAAEAFHAELERFDDAAVPYSALGYLYLRSDRVDAARRAFSAALAVEPGKSHALHGLALLFRRTGQPQAAVDLLRDRIAEASPSDARFLRSQLDAARLEVASAHSARPQVSHEWETTRLYVSAKHPVMLRGQAKLLRRAAHREPARAQELRAAASGLLGQATNGNSDDRSEAEKVRLLADDSAFGQARELARQRLQHAPASLPLWHALGQVGVDEARAERREFTSAEMTALRDPYRRLQQLNPATLPVADLGYARVALSLRDGVIADDAAREALGELAPRSGVEGHGTWWRSRVYALLVGDTDPEAAWSHDQVEETRGRAAQHALLLNELEHEFVLQAAS